MKRQLTIIVIMAFCCCHVQSQENRTFVNPGIKLGYTFGEGHGFTLGVECSVTQSDRYSYGGVAAIDVTTGGMVRFHVGVEAAALIGIEWGPTLIVDRTGTALGHSLTPFIGVVLYPYYTITFRRQSENLEEAGTYIKVPILTAGPHFSLGG